MNLLEQKQTLLTHEADAFGLWRPDAAFRLMQEIAGAHSAAIGLSREDLIASSNMVWMIARAHLVVTRYPKLHDTIYAKTWYDLPGRTTFPRYVTVTDELGAPLAAIATSWILVDVSSRRILPPGKAGLAFPQPAQLVSPLPEPGKLRLNKAGTPQITCRAPLYSDIDENGHMNNASYVSWILDLFPLEQHRKKRIRSLCVGYSSEARPGEQVEISLYRNGDLFEVQGADLADKHVVFEAQGEWGPA